MKTRLFPLPAVQGCTMPGVKIHLSPGSDIECCLSMPVDVLSLHPGQKAWLLSVIFFDEAVQKYLLQSGRWPVYKHRLLFFRRCRWKCKRCDRFLCENR